MYYIANFQYVSDQQQADENNRRHGSFSMLMAAEDLDAALEKFRLKLVDYKKATTFFEGKCTVYITQLLQLDSIPKDEAMVLNFKSFAGDPVMPHIACAVPTEQSNACSIHEWQDGRPLTEGEQDSVFIHFEL